MKKESADKLVKQTLTPLPDPLPRYGHACAGAKMPRVTIIRG
jgi:hypothetical protein